MNLLTEVSLPEYPFHIDHRSPGLLLGSCFTENIGSLLRKFLFPVSVNPFGVSYNPLSVHTGLTALMEKERYVEKDLNQHNGLWFSFDHYTRFSSPEAKVTQKSINQAFLPAKNLLKKASYVILTWGTAWVYTYKKDGKVVCNCHKIPAAEFGRSRLTVEEIVNAYSDLIPRLTEINDSLRIVLTVSPVRHWKDGAHGNQLSKATLLLATELLCTRFPDRVFYFPSYEIVMDELRDYRYYAGDLLHTNDQATRYIWERFERSLIGESSQQIIRDLEPLLKLLEHKPRNIQGEAHRKTEQGMRELAAGLKQKYPFLDWSTLHLNE